MLGAAEVAAWERHLRLGRGLAAKTVACYRRHVERMLADVGHAPTELTTALLEGHLDRLALDAGRPSAALKSLCIRSRITKMITAQSPMARSPKRAYTKKRFWHQG